MDIPNEALEDIINEEMNPRLISALYKNFSDQYIALFELIDNAVDDLIPGQTLTVTINYDKQDEKIVIKDSGGKGMDYDDLKRFFKWGVSEKNMKIGRYGQGGKAALGYLCKSFIIKSHPIDTSNIYIIKADNWDSRDDKLKKFQIEKSTTLIDKNIGYTNFEVYHLKKYFQTNTITDKIKEIYRPLIVRNIVEFYIGPDKVICQPANYDEGTLKKFKLDLPFTVNGKPVSIFGECGIVSDKKSIRGGINIYNHGRCIVKKEYFRHIDPSRRWNVERLYGELFIDDFDMPLSMNKTDIDRSSTEWRFIESLMHNQLESIIRQAVDYKVPTTKEEKVINKISKRVCEDKDGESLGGIKLSTYGRTLLFKVHEESDGKTTLLINREHPAYDKWATTDIGKKLYAILMYSLFAATKELPKREASDLLNKFSASLKEQTDKLI